MSLISFHAPFAIWIANCFVDECWMNRYTVLGPICNAFCYCMLFDVSYGNKVILILNLNLSACAAPPAGQGVVVDHWSTISSSDSCHVGPVFPLGGPEMTEKIAEICVSNHFLKTVLYFFKFSMSILPRPDLTSGEDVHPTLPYCNQTAVLSLTIEKESHHTPFNVYLKY